MPLFPRCSLIATPACPAPTTSTSVLSTDIGWPPPCLPQGRNARRSGSANQGQWLSRRPDGSLIDCRRGHPTIYRKGRRPRRRFAGGSASRMDHSAPLIATIVIGLVLAFVLGAIADRLRISPLVGYLLAGVAVGPFTPGFIADQSLARQLADI